MRIDDADEQRTKKKWLEDIFKTLDWLGLDIDEGPSSVDDFIQNYSQQKKKDYYFGKLQKNKRTFVCQCSRRDVVGTYQGTCLEQSLAYGPCHNCIRLNLAPEYPILWRKENIPAYHFSSIIDDHDLGITDIIRGDDLKESSQLQIQIAQKLGITFTPQIFHHELIMGLDNKKLSKTQRDLGVRDQFRDRKEFFTFLAKRWQIEPFMKLKELPLRKLPKEVLLPLQQ